MNSCRFRCISNNYLQSFYTVGTANAALAIKQIETLTPVYIYDDRAEYYFTSTSLINGQTIGFPWNLIKKMEYGRFWNFKRRTSEGLHL